MCFILLLCYETVQYSCQCFLMVFFSIFKNLHKPKDNRENTDGTGISLVISTTGVLNLIHSYMLACVCRFDLLGSVFDAQECLDITILVC